MPWHPRLSSQFSPARSIEIRKNGDDIAPDLPGGEARMTITQGRGQADRDSESGDLQGGGYYSGDAVRAIDVTREL